jgi:hypothetical protein
MGNTDDDDRALMGERSGLDIGAAILYEIGTYSRTDWSDTSPDQSVAGQRNFSRWPVFSFKKNDRLAREAAI